ncbi:MAG TPA: protein kinase [Gemmataceae bacterium]|jgi:serine/threonine protein kinase|nr:protein kinase [Gemmataceae bacterium]
MQPRTAKHPGPERLAAFALGLLDEDGTQAVREHMAECAQCRQEIEGRSESSILTQIGTRLENPAAYAKAPPAPEDLEIPLELKNHPRYRMLRFLGAGGMGMVFEAEHRVMKRRVALKIIKPSLTQTPFLVDRFEREVRAAATLLHPNIVTAHDADQAGGLHFLVMEYVEGTNLTRVVLRKGTLPVEFASNYIRQAALGLQHAFEKDMVHCDLKPQNLMLTPKGQIKILDFGMSRFLTDRENTPGSSPDMVMGTPDYIAPEQTISSRLADIRSDIYSLGCTFYFLLTNQPPFPDGDVYQKLAAHREKTPRRLVEMRADIPPEVVQLIERMMAKEPKDRPQTPADVAKALLPYSKAVPSSVVLSVSAATVVPDGATELMPAPPSESPKKVEEPEAKPAEKPRPTTRLSRRRPRRRSFFEQYGYLIILAVAGLIVIGALVTAGMMLHWQVNKLPVPAKQK